MSESRAAELLGLTIPEYLERRYDAIQAVLQLVETLPSPLVSLVEVCKKQPEFFNE